MKENVILSPDLQSSEKYMHGIKVLMAKNYIDNLIEEVRKGMRQEAREGMWPSSRRSATLTSMVQTARK